MKTKTNISVRNSLGYHTTSNMILGEAHGYQSGDILDANAVAELVYAIITGEVFPGGITSENIQDGTISVNDLSREVIDKMTSTYNENDQALYLNGSREI